MKTLTKRWPICLLSIGLVGLTYGDSLAQDPTLELIGGTGTNLLISSNLNLGLAVELHKADPKKRPVTVQVAEQPDNTLKVTIDQFNRWQASVRLTAEDKEYLELLVSGLKGVKAQAAALKIALKEDNRAQLDEYTKRRKKRSRLSKR